MLLFGLLTVAATAFAERPVYRALDERGGVTYTDRPAAAEAPVRLRPAAGPRPLQSDAAVVRGASERLYLERLRIEARQPRPVLLYQPRVDPPARSTPPSQPHWRLRNRWDPGLPDAPPASSSERRYYDGTR